MANKGNTRHGMYGTPTYKSWAEMKYRCGNPKRPDYFSRTYCEEWEQFSQFFEDMGERPEGTSLDRVNNSKGYSKDNCRWATRNQQNNNRKSTRLFEWNGRRATLKGWEKIVGVKRSTLAQRIYVYRWPVAKALSKEVD